MHGAWHMRVVRSGILGRLPGPWAVELICHPPKVSELIHRVFTHPSHLGLYSPPHPPTPPYSPQHLGINLSPQGAGGAGKYKPIRGVGRGGWVRR